MKYYIAKLFKNIYIYIKIDDKQKGKHFMKRA